jgi:DNA-binding phage protein
MNEQWTAFDAATYLTTDAYRLDYVAQSFETGESARIVNALATVARAKGLDVQEWGELLGENVTLSLVLGLMKALDMKLVAVACDPRNGSEAIT